MIQLYASDQVGGIIADQMKETLDNYRPGNDSDVGTYRDSHVPNFIKYMKNLLAKQEKLLHPAIEVQESIPRDDPAEFLRAQIMKFLKDILQLLNKDLPITGVKEDLVVRIYKLLTSDGITANNALPKLKTRIASDSSMGAYREPKISKKRPVDADVAEDEDEEDRDADDVNKVAYMQVIDAVRFENHTQESTMCVITISRAL